MIKELIEKFERLKSIKYAKFSHTNAGSLDSEETINRVKSLIQAYNDDVFVLCDLEPFINNNHSIKKEPSYLNMLVSYLRVYKDNPNMILDKETEEKIRNDEHVIEALIYLDDRLEKGVEKTISYAPVQKEILDIEEIINRLKEIDSFEYIDQPIIKMIYDYLKTETHISYQEKYIEIGTIIAKHNINVGKKRTRM